MNLFRIKFGALFQGLLLGCALGWASQLAVPPFNAVLCLMGTRPVGLKSQMFWELIYQVPVLKIGVPILGKNPLLLRKKLHVLSSLMIWVALSGVAFLTGW